MKCSEANRAVRGEDHVIPVAGLGLGLAARDHLKNSTLLPHTALWRVTVKYVLLMLLWLIQLLPLFQLGLFGVISPLWRVVHWNITLPR